MQLPWMVTAHEYQNSPNSVYAIKLHAQHTHYTTTLGQLTPVMPTARSTANRNERYQPTDTPGTHHAVTLYNPTSDCVTYTVQRWLDHTGKEEERAQPPHLLCVNNLLCIVHRILHKPNYQAYWHLLLRPDGQSKLHGTDGYQPHNTSPVYSEVLALLLSARSEHIQQECHVL